MRRIATEEYARTADKTVTEEYFNVTEKVEALYDQPRQLPHDDEGNEMRKLRAEMHRRMLGNAHCARPVDTDCHFESICESCTFFVITIEFRPTPQAQRDDAHDKGQATLPTEDLRRPARAPRQRGLMNRGLTRSPAYLQPPPAALDARLLQPPGYEQHYWAGRLTETAA